MKSSTQRLLTNTFLLPFTVVVMVSAVWLVNLMRKQKGGRG